MTTGLPIWNRSIPTALTYLGLFLLALSTRLWLVATHGSDLPFWDEWNALANPTFGSFLRGEPWISGLFRPHNEHYIVTTRLIHLGMLQVNGLWDPFLSLTFNALLYAGAVCLLYGLTRRSGELESQALCGVAAVAVLFPMGWQNTLWAFQGCFYLVIIFSYIAFWCYWRFAMFSSGWWLGSLAALLAHMSMAGGALIPIAAALVSLVRTLASGSRKQRDYLGTTFLLTLGLAFVRTIPSVPQHETLGADSIGSFFSAALTVFGWPHEGAFRWLSISLHLPTVGLLCAVVIRRIPFRDGSWLLLSILIWSELQNLALAYSRANHELLASRYRDLFILTLLANLSAVLALIRVAGGTNRRFSAAGTFAWVTVFVVGLISFSLRHVEAEIVDRSSYMSEMLKNTRRYIFSGMLEDLEDRRIPFPSLEVLIAAVDDSAIRLVLPTSIRPPITPSSHTDPGATFSHDGVYPTTSLLERDLVWGSYSRTEGNANTGAESIQFLAPDQSNLFILPISGYPNAPGNSIEVISQCGKVTRLPIPADPRETWTNVTFKTDGGPFQIRLEDGNETFWFAIGAPRECGRYWVVARKFASSWQYLMAAGVASLLAAHLARRWKELPHRNELFADGNKLVR